MESDAGQRINVRFVSEEHMLGLVSRTFFFNPCHV